MKKSLLITNILLALAIVVLFILHFSGTGIKLGSEISADETRQTIMTAGENPDIAWVNIDTLLVNFEMFRENQEELKSKQEESEAKLSTRGKAYERQAADFQEKVSKQLVTRATAAQMEQSLMQKQQELINLRDQLTMELQEEETVRNRQVLNYVMDFLEEYNKDFGYKYILSTSFGGPVLYSDASLDITEDVLKAINKKYLSEK